MNVIRTGSKKCLAVVLLLSFIFFADVTAFAANGFQYQHDPLAHPAAGRDIMADENAVYGYRPTATGSLALYADADWTDPEVVAQGRVDRIAYHESVESMYEMLREMREQGKSTEEIARAVSTRRNEIRLEAYADDPEGLAALKERNLEKYGSWERVMEKSFSTNAGMDACLGLYDDYYFLYVALGDVPADMTVALPEAVDCGYHKTVTLTPSIGTNAISYTVRFESEDPAVAAVDENGTVTGLKWGETDVRCIVTDASGCEHSSEPCRVSVRSNLLLWLTRLIAFFKNLFMC